MRSPDSIFRRSWRRGHARLRVVVVSLAVAVAVVAGRSAEGQGVGVIAVPPSAMLPHGAAGRLQLLIRERADNIEKFQVFAALKKIQQQQPQLNALQADILAAEKLWRAANFQFTKISSQARGEAGKGMAGQVAAARQAVNQANQNVDKARLKLASFFAANIQPWLEKVDAARPDWARIYRSMRELVPTDRADPGAGEVAAVYSAECRRQENFVEGYVLGAIAAIYVNDLQEARDSLEKAAKLIVEYQLGDLLVATDYCHACLLLGKPDACEAVVDFIKNMPDTATSIEQDCIVGLHAYATRKFNEGAKFYTRAIHKQARLKRADNLDASPALWGEAAMLFMQLDDVNQRNKAKLVLEKEPQTQSGAWQVLRARAELAADAGDWGEAAGLIDASEARAPLAMQAELRAHGEAIKAQKRWNARLFQRPAAAVVPNAAGAVVRNDAAPNNPGLADLAGVLGGLGAAMEATNRVAEKQRAEDAARRPPEADESSDPRYAYDGKFPKCAFRKQFEALDGKTDLDSLQTWGRMKLILARRGLTLNGLDWAEHQSNNRVAVASLEGEERTLYIKYLELVKDGW
jgi:hypothetical protein